MPDSGNCQQAGRDMADKEILPDASRNLLGVGCPMNMVYAKVELARLGSGQVLELVLDDGAPVSNVSGSIQKEGHEILAKRQMPAGGWSIFIRKG